MTASRRSGRPTKRAPKKIPVAKKKAAAAGPRRRDHHVIGVRARSIARILGSTYPDAHCMLDHEGPFELLVATILAAQCTDERVNKVTPALFNRFPTPAAMAAADVDELEKLIRSTGFYRNKAKSIKGASETLSSRFP